jgi:signal transduction histidine kinase
MASTRGSGTAPGTTARTPARAAANDGAALQAALDQAKAEIERLLADSRQRQAELAIVNEIIHSLARQRDFGQIVEAVGDRAAAALAVRGMSISTVDPSTGELTFHFWIDEGVRNYAMEGIKLGDSLSAEILDKNRAVRIGSAEEAAARGTPFKIGGTESYLGVPIPAGDRAIGVFALGTRERDAYSATDERLVTTMAQAMGVALDNARLAAKTRQQVAELAIVNEVNQAVGAQLGPDAVIELVGDRVRETFDADIAYVALLDKSGQRVDFPYYNENGDRKPPASISYGQGWTSRILTTGQPLRVSSEQERDSVETQALGTSPKSYLGVPIRVGDDSIGVLAVQSTRDEDAFDDADQGLLSTIAAGVGVAIQNAELYTETRRLLAETNQRAAELEIVNEVGRALARQLEFGQIVEAVGDRAAAALGVRGLSISIVDPVTDELRFYYWIDEGVRNTAREGIVLGDPLSAEILRTNRAVRINSAGEAAARGTPFKIGGTESYVGVPIPVGDGAIGVFAIGTREPHAYTDSEERLLTTLASAMGVALENARLIEETRRLFAEMQRAKEQAEAANEAKSTFLASVSHELRTPLTSVLGFAKVIRRQLDERILPQVDAADAKTERAINQVRDNMDVIVTEGERLTTLVNNVLDLAKIEAGRFEWNMQPTSMAQVIDRALATTAGLAEAKGLELRRDVADDLPPVLADRDGVLQVVINLISNAVKFTDHGSVTCRATLTKEGLLVGVTDTGIGIAPADQERVFDKFTQVGDTLTDKPHGTGLGLPICREIVERHGGRIWVESEAGKGSTFYFVLPLTPSRT